MYIMVKISLKGLILANNLFFSIINWKKLDEGKINGKEMSRKQELEPGRSLILETQLSTKFDAHIFCYII